MGALCNVQRNLVRFKKFSNRFWNPCDLSSWDPSNPGILFLGRNLYIFLGEGDTIFLGLFFTRWSNTLLTTCYSLFKCRYDIFRNITSLPHQSVKCEKSCINCVFCLRVLRAVQLFDDTGSSCKKYTPRWCRINFIKFTITQL